MELRQLINEDKVRMKDRLKNNKEEVIRNMQLIRNIIGMASSLPYKNLTDLAAAYNVSTSALYKMWKTKTGRSWSEGIDIEMLIRPQALKNKRPSKKNKDDRTTSTE